MLLASPPVHAQWTPPAAPALVGPIPASEYATRRAALAQSLEDGVFLGLGEPEPAADYLPFVQNSDFLYLTGITEPAAALVMIKRGGSVQEWLFVRPRNPARELWEGYRLGAEGALETTGIPARSNAELPAVLDSLLAGGGTLYTLRAGAEPRLDRPLDPQVQAINLLATRHAGLRVVPVSRQISALRARKSTAELDLIRRAVFITNIAHNEILRTIEPGLHEFEIQALLEYTFRRNGADRPSFASIVGSGPNSTTLHYNENDRLMQAGDVVVIDIGASYRGYAADVTRTLPVGGRFSPEQRAIYELVLSAQKAAEQLARPGATMGELNTVASRILAEGLTSLGLIDSPDAVYDSPTGAQPQLRLFYMHSLGHGVGLDVHDPNLSPFGEGSAFTIEPGIYVRGDAFHYLPDTERNRAMIQRLRPALERYRDIGVRIEDVYLVTATGVERVSSGAPREIEEIEALLARERRRLDRQPAVVDWYRATSP